MKVFAPITKEAIGGGWSFYRNFKKGMQALGVEFVDRWEDCDIFFITGITIVEMGEVHKAQQAGKRIILRVDNVPRKSRNRRSSPHERLKEIAGIADTVIYQSEWARMYCKPLCGEGTVIYNGVDESIFYPPKDSVPGRSNNYLFIYHGNNDHKGFATAHYLFQLRARENPQAKFFFINDFGRNLAELMESKFDFWNGENYEYLPKLESPQEVAELMRECGTLLYPSICDASPNTVLEARACGMDVTGYPDKMLSGTAELMERENISIENMCEDYFGVFSVLL